MYLHMASKSRFAVAQAPGSTKHDDLIKKKLFGVHAQVSLLFLVVVVIGVVVVVLVVVVVVVVVINRRL